MKHLLLTAAAMAVLTSPAIGAATRCRGANGKFIACAHAAAPAATGVTRDASGRCRQAGKFVKCPAAH